ncbi:clamp loader subunit [Synechococcus phage S-RIM8 A.HR3]|uniref:Clamp loader subunit n=2 Tax=Neptunevirus srim18 TaxID=2734121 RepID=A0A1D7SC06_9CAUD|nr:clamp loader of DNA polymerase [Synechococcus phage S-RIM8 A.HR1]YP_009783058.1 clamp loader of DNA polymerase [Synechococcus phage S-RIM8]AFB15419.1 clamp loader subunit [Synechococcus phage S-RIM8 A.HR5]AFB17847.1 clamp loader subunit [Synechococcus phage S-RIM8 A.HR3]AGH57899.1 clamp loader [Synechococcus phage KBS-M-1A]AFB17636.1 clamp loader subunit [Synechococcus phage S-RIM8 A.HR1]AOO11181.1 clamp loader subunit [Synechococcus phage S-RIM8]
MSFDERYPLKDYLNSINLSKKNLMEDEDPAWEKNYPPYIINKCMSHHMDTVMFANEMNQYPGLDKKLQYDFFINTVRPRKRFSPWGKKEKVKNIELVKEFYGYSTEKALQALRILTDNQLEIIRTKLNKGGKKK